MKKFKDFKNEEIEKDVWYMAVKIQEHLQFCIKNKQIYATLNGCEFATGVYPEKIIKNYLKDVDLSDYLIEDFIDTREDYIEKIKDAYIVTLDRLTDDSGITSLAYTLKVNSNKEFTFENAIKIIKKSMKKLLYEEIYSDVDWSMYADREYAYRNKLGGF